MLVRTCVPGVVLSDMLALSRLMDGTDSSSMNTLVGTYALSDPSLAKMSAGTLRSRTM